ncbi:transcription factor EMB1444-like isoform X2 [Cornus florida]|uniref:transcription factor EMB1444-like isoform X2 n=1 Tax=Cornus florida TaxID=4283 RepID=UPI00289DA668|nr:transcription factor EMB1444-like isoform X2 [Cornus florida]
MGTQLHQALRTLCSNTEWNYAVFWKLKHRARMIVGQVAVTGKYLWIFADTHAIDPSSSYNYCDGWQTQFSAGIRTVVVVAVVPHGVVQLGSLNKVSEDLKLVNRIREIFYAFQDSSVECIPSVVQYSMASSSCLSAISTRSSSSGIVSDCIHNLDRTMNKEKTNIWSPVFPSLEKSEDRSYPLPGAYLKKTVEMIDKHGGHELSTPEDHESANLLQSRSDLFLVEWQKQEQTNLIVDKKFEEKTSGFRDRGLGSEDTDTSILHNCYNNGTGLYNVTVPSDNLYNVTVPSDNLGVDIMHFPSDLPNSAAWDNHNGVLCMPEPFDMQIQKDLMKNFENQTEFNHVDTLNTSFKFSAGCELYEALGPAFRTQNMYGDCEMGKTETETTIDVPSRLSSNNLLMTDSGSEHLLEAVVANVCSSGTDVESGNSFCKSGQSLLSTEKMSDPSNGQHAIGSTNCSFEWSLAEEDKVHCLNSSKTCARSTKGFSSTSPSTCSQQSERPQEPAKINKKRVRSGENCRPRPRDRQLIQDRIKELRELVPNGSKCSIDSLLEQTIKHMLFLQSITRHADKLNECAESKLCDKGTGIRGLSSCEQGSSWAVEVGSHLKVCPIMVENINMDGQMLIEMLCEDCSHFLEVAEAVRSLGLIILKGVTETYGEKTWMCFIVEGQNNRSVHRMDILWSLVQILQPKTKI